MKRLLLISLILTGCSSVKPIPPDQVMINYGKGCNVTVYETRADATFHGEILDMCETEVSGASAYDQMSQAAIHEAAQKACDCGTDKVYFMRRQPTGTGATGLSMVAFRYWPDWL